jgi:hypothetical protein
VFKKHLPVIPTYFKTNDSRSAQKPENVQEVSVGKYKTYGYIVQNIKTFS